VNGRGRHFNLTGIKSPNDELAQYQMPPPGACDTFSEHVTAAFPPVDRPEVFGIHYNAHAFTVKAQGLTLLERIGVFKYHDGAAGGGGPSASRGGGQESQDLPS